MYIYIYVYICMYIYIYPGGSFVMFISTTEKTQRFMIKTLGIQNLHGLREMCSSCFGD